MLRPSPDIHRGRGEPQGRGTHDDPSLPRRDVAGTSPSRLAATQPSSQSEKNLAPQPLPLTLTMS